MKNITLNSVLKQSGQLTTEELIDLNHTVIKMIKARRRAESTSKATTLRVGQIVEVNHPKHRGNKFEITKVKVTKCDIRSVNGLGHFTAPMHLLITNC